ncbi:hypothetical protein N0V88_001867 [Collariella sp. IMI 366227]|nr:hypothetical protein N0V88_001867 [Collariella sp. IMI 366227]
MSVLAEIASKLKDGTPCHYAAKFSLGQFYVPTGPFRLTNRDFEAHNTLVNSDFNIVGVIDFDGVIAAPLEVVAQYPVLSCLQIEPLGVVYTNPVAVERVTEPEVRGIMRWFVGEVEMAEVRGFRGQVFIRGSGSTRNIRVL